VAKWSGAVSSPGTKMPAPFDELRAGRLTPSAPLEVACEPRAKVSELGVAL